MDTFKYTQKLESDEPAEIRSAVERAFNHGSKVVGIGVDGGEGHVYRDSPFREFAILDGVVTVIRRCTGLEWYDVQYPATTEDFQLPGYGKAWIMV
jgi:hypothetical protein